MKAPRISIFMLVQVFMACGIIGLTVYIVFANPYSGCVKVNPRSLPGSAPVVCCNRFMDPDTYWICRNFDAFNPNCTSQSVNKTQLQIIADDAVGSYNVVGFNAP